MVLAPSDASGCPPEVRTRRKPARAAAKDEAKAAEDLAKSGTDPLSAWNEHRRHSGPILSSIKAFRTAVTGAKTADAGPVKNVRRG